MHQDIPSDISQWDDQDLRAFIKENAAVFRAFASKYVHDLDVVDDVLQEAYIKLWTNKAKIGEVKSPRNYFFSIVKHTILGNKNYYMPENMERDEASYMNISDENTFLQNIIEVEASNMIAQAIMKLSPQSQQVILMSIEGKSMKEIAEDLDITVNTVKTVKYRAIERLAGLLSKEDFVCLLGACGISLIF
ncbi:MULTISPECIES: RNA polymerase sigma factor [Butyricimonas]|jgi:RNA polymerase sigma factor, sigma-70 family|uniref:RNA polymerase sigma-70 factor (ECF subfamily) n=1 Tax=Butyricimonas paravirosa TaxID=1472417 RepID=A0A7X5YHM5_9BACT|nr:MULTISPECIES: sigma-70 family RNA polymerase sigma factor [Odoribacteraceae]NJC20056.1 RNA polymerase sigma-70 factor (ECF subfamily) [Butyricimonas paravirosa]RGG45988.1 hypothetical protein DWX82_15025 [Odoribacter sp. AF21-41]RHH89992.1 hypothetical protein DW186_17405 [Odoribacter sp. AM16-33]WOF12321.1 sigma-70 family RNA polymerase sigma factor [Butyricimonas paravirosa]GGJ72835.1 hypothetical protein GCM10007042_34860 [Butyricimonas paravirosa]